ALEHYVPGRDGGLAVRRVLDAVGVDGGAPLAQHNVARGGDALFLLAFDVLGFEELRAFALRPRRHPREVLFAPERDALCLGGGRRRQERVGEREWKRADASWPQGNGEA